MRRLGIDPGTVRTGLAVSDDEVCVAVPLRTVEHKTIGQAVRQVAAIVAQEEIGEIVIGLPLALSGREGEAARKVRRFARELTALVGAGVPVVMWDERLSSAAAERALREQGVKGDAKRRVVDQAAATLLLQSYLDQQREHTWDEDELDETEAHARSPRGA
jgi:putative Holliday junction resolvase